MVDLSAIAKWPNVPACYEWLSLDRRGDWRLRGERVTHRGLIDFINRQYAVDETGRGVVHNGPQRVYVDLAGTPWIFRRDGDAFVAHTGRPAGDILSVHLDDGGSLLFETELGIGLLDDRDLAATLAECAATDADWEALLAGEARAVTWRGHAIRPILAVDLPKRFNFEPRPRP